MSRTPTLLLLVASLLLISIPKSLAYRSLTFIKKEPSKVILKKGNLQFLKEEKSILIKYDHSNTKVGAFDREEDYVNERATVFNQKEPGRGDKWKKIWEGSKKKRYQPRFEASLNKQLARKGINVSQNSKNSQYTLIVKTTSVEAGFDAIVYINSAFVSYEFFFVETGNESNIVAELYLNNVKSPQPDDSEDYTAESRIAESYAKSGKMLGDFIYKAIKK